MLKSELEDIIGQEFKLDKVLSKNIINILVDSMIDSIKNNNRIEIRGFGSFFPKTYNSYNGRNPKTGETILVPKKILPIFMCNKPLELFNLFLVFNKMNSNRGTTIIWLNYKWRSKRYPI